MYIGIFSVSLNILLDWLWKDTLGGPGLTLATTVASLSGAVVMLVILRRHLGNMHLKRSVGQFLRMLLCTAAAVVFILIALELIPYPGLDAFGPALIRLIVGAVVGLTVYFAAAFALNIHEARRVVSILRRRLVRH